MNVVKALLHLSTDFIQRIKHQLKTHISFSTSTTLPHAVRQIDATLKMSLIMALLAIPLVWQYGASRARELSLISCILMACGIAILLWRLHRGNVQFATYGLLTLMISIILVSGLLATPERGATAPYFLVLAVATAGFVLSLRRLFIVILVCIGVILILNLVLTSQWQATLAEEEIRVDITSAILLLISISAIIAFNSHILHTTQASADAHQHALKLRNAELEQEITERQRIQSQVNLRTLELQQLLNTSRVLSSTLELKPSLRTILTHLSSLIGFDTVKIAEFVNPDQYIVLASLPNDWVDAPTPIIYTLDKSDCHLQALIETREPVLMDNIFADHPFARAQHARWLRMRGALPAHLRSSLLLPLLVRDQIIGYVSFYSATTGFYTPALADLGMIIAAQIGSVIDGVRSREKALSAASYAAKMSERSRLARELHDSVSQALFGIVLGANTMLTRAHTHQPVTEDSMTYVLGLAETALSDMRALIIELRPETLQTQGLLHLLRKQTEMIAVRNQLPIVTHFPDEEPSLSLEAKEALYRIALEAIQNTIKHADAEQVDIWLEQKGGRVQLRIEDNGKGFNPNGIFQGHFGLKTMAERAQMFGGSVRFINPPEHGTCVVVEIPVMQL